MKVDSHLLVLKTSAEQYILCSKTFHFTDKHMKHIYVVKIIHISSVYFPSSTVKKNRYTVTGRAVSRESERYGSTNTQWKS